MMIFPALLSIAVRRLHDTGRNGWWLLLLFIPAILIAADEFDVIHIPYLLIIFFLVLHYIGLFTILYFLFQKSQPGTNSYGANPHEKPIESTQEDKDALNTFFKIINKEKDN
jgi:uncharacterized membrane protein YhaH (DUF805 family)